MLTLMAKGYVLAGTLFVVCCLVNPNDAIPYRSSLRSKEQTDDRVGDRSGSGVPSVAQQLIEYPDMSADKEPALSGKAEKLPSSQNPESPSSRIKNAWKATNEGILATSSDVSKGISMESLITRTVNCSEFDNKNNRYTSSFATSGNASGTSLNVANDDYTVTGEMGATKSRSVHVGEDITLCWIETTTIKEDRSLKPVQRFVVREYTISFENSATIPERYQECVQVEGEVGENDNHVPKSALFEVMDENTRHSRVVNFTAVSHTLNLTIWQHRRVRCGVGPVVTRTVIEWTDKDSAKPKQRVEIKVSPKLHRLVAEPTQNDTYTTDNDNEQTTAFTETCGPEMICDNSSECTDESCLPSTTPVESLEDLDSNDETTESDSISLSSEETETSTIAAEDSESHEILLTGVTKGPSLTTKAMTDTESKITETTELNTLSNGETTAITSDYESSDSSGATSMVSITVTHKPDIGTTPIENQNTDSSDSSDDSYPDLSTSESEESCESQESCTNDAYEESTPSWEESTIQNQITDVVTQRDTEVTNTEDIFSTATTDTSVTQITDSTGDYLTEAETAATTKIVESTENPGDFESTGWSDITDTTAQSAEIITTNPYDETSEVWTTEGTTTGSEITKSNTEVSFTDHDVINGITSTQKISTEQFTLSCESSEECHTGSSNQEPKTTSVPALSSAESCDESDSSESCKFTTSGSNAVTVTAETVSTEDVTNPDLHAITKNHDQVTTDVTFTTTVTRESTSTVIDEKTQASTASGLVDVSTETSTSGSTDFELQGESGSGECDSSFLDGCDLTVSTVELATTTTSLPCDSDFDSCGSDASSDSSCDEESGNCSMDSSPELTNSCDEELESCSTDLSGSSSMCDEESGDCGIDATTTSTSICDEFSSYSCTTISDVDGFVTFTDSTENCEDDSSGSCTISTHKTDGTDMTFTTSSTPTDVENVSTAVSDGSSTVESESTTTKATSIDSVANHKLALKIKVLLEQIDENMNRQKLLEIEKHLIFDEDPNEHEQNLLMEQVQDLNDTVNTETVQGSFNYSMIEKLTSDMMADFAAKYLAMHNDTSKSKEAIGNVSAPKGLHVRKREVDPNLEISLPEIHDDIHSGLAHLMTRLPSQEGVNKRILEAIEEEHPRSRILEVVTDPLVHARRKRKTFEDSTIDQQDLPKDLEELGHWSNERVRRSIKGGHVRTLTQLTVYKGP